jgi:hypothetical protein
VVRPSLSQRAGVVESDFEAVVQQDNSDADFEVGRVIPHWMGGRGDGGLTKTTNRKLMLILLIILAILLIGSAPAWPYSRGWGYYPSSGIGTILLILLILWLLGVI